MIHALGLAAVVFLAYGLIAYALFYRPEESDNEQ